MQLDYAPIAHLAMVERSLQNSAFPKHSLEVELGFVDGIGDDGTNACFCAPRGFTLAEDSSDWCPGADVVTVVVHIFDRH